MRASRRALLAAPFLIGGGGYGAYRGLEYWCTNVEAERLELTAKNVALPGLTAPVRVLHIADFHLEMPGTLAFLERAFAMGLAEKPDFVVISGDFITDRLIDFDGYVRSLQKLPAARPTYAVTGNHDGGVWSADRRGYADSSLVRKVIEHAGIEMLHNRNVNIEVRGQRIRLTGIADFWSGEARPETAFSGVTEGVTSLALAHNPDSKEQLARFPWNLLLVGHTHGGQWRVPIIDWPPYVPLLDRRFLEGLHPWQGRQIHVTRGVGSILHSRLNCRPEVSILNLVPVA